MKVDQTHQRSGAIITPLGGKPVAYGSINEAKRESAKLQRANGGLGAGAVRLKR